MRSSVSIRKIAPVLLKVSLISEDEFVQGNESRSPIWQVQVKAKKARRGRNPQNGEELTIKAGKVVTFKPSNLFRKGLHTLIPGAVDGKTGYMESGRLKHAKTIGLKKDFLTVENQGVSLIPELIGMGYIRRCLDETDMDSGSPVYPSYLWDHRHSYYYS